ncbi:putative peptidase DUF31 [Mycoplasma testudineum]|uniref:Putative peptidase DUF31 n=1 Tax=Mycoplasma testudineum TaxID=244584 RepID=A0A4V3C2W0_9MOLU|nr:DUF31 family protein [Mycoplasma testudineum]OYD26753.1 hypothetical protein CG473_02245 [Mycoplasma testudineum]TDO19889.1 putative peptidase DUF31 [Mycoplasma testudineum]
MRKFKKIALGTIATSTVAISAIAATSCGHLFGSYDFDFDEYPNAGKDLNTWNWDSSSERFRITIPNPDISSENKLIWPSVYQSYSDRPRFPTQSTTEANQEWFAPNEHYAKNFKTSFALRFENTSNEGNAASNSTVLGTGWILDYIIPNDGTYPTKWYIATNLHVANNLRNPGDENARLLFTKEFVMTKWDIGKNTYKDEVKAGDYSLAKSYVTGNYNSSNQLVGGAPALLKSIPKTVYAGVDYLVDSPKNWNPSLYEEMIDFAVIEVEFINSETAQEATSDYANLAPSEQNKFLQTPYLSDPNAKNVNFYISGFPNGRPEINRSVFGGNDGLKKYDTSLAQGELDSIVDNYQLGDKLTQSVTSYNTFELDSPKGIGDALLILPYFSTSYKGTPYTPWALVYSFSNSGLDGGSSGSKVTNENDEIVAIHALGSSSSESNLAFALKSNGYTHANYNGYVTPAYDIIMGGFQGQKTSYAQAMKELYSGQGINTKLIGIIQ